MKPYNLTYFIRLFAVATFSAHKYIPSHRKPYKMFYIGSFIMKHIKTHLANHYLSIDNKRLQR